MTAHHGQPVPISGTGSSDTNGLASFRHLRAYRPATRTRYCPRCKTGVLAYSRRGDDPWAYCTSPDCPYEFD